MAKHKLGTKTIEEVTETLIDYRGKTPRKTASGVKLITAKVIKEGFVLDGPHEYIAEVASRHQRQAAQPGGAQQEPHGLPGTVPKDD